jgi:hypothetical protein
MLAHASVYHVETPYILSSPQRGHPKGRCSGHHPPHPGLCHVTIVDIHLLIFLVCGKYKNIFLQTNRFYCFFATFTSTTPSNRLKSIE